MVGKLDNMVTAAVVIDSALTAKSSSAQTQNATTKIKPVESEQEQPASQTTLSSLKTLEPTSTDPTKKAEEEDKKQPGRLEPGTMDEASVSKMTEEFNKLMSKINVNLEFKYNKEVDMFNVKMIDKETKKVLREFPPEEMLESMIKTKEWLGAFIDRAI